MTVRPARSWRDRKTFCFAVFVLAALGAYGWGRIRGERLAAGNGCSATAKVYHELLPEADASGETTDGERASTAAEKNRIAEGVLAEANLAAALGEDSEAPAEAARGGLSRQVEAARQKIDVHVADLSDPPGVQVAITCREADAAEAAWLANRLARRYADQFRRQWKGRVQAAYSEACERADSAARDLEEARAQLDQFFQDRLNQQAERREASGSKGSPETNGAGRPEGPQIDAPASESGTPELVENPQWVELNEQLERLVAERETMLVDRTAEHPVVLRLEQEIADARAALKRTPMLVPGGHDGSGSTIRPAAAPRDGMPPSEAPRDGMSPAEAERRFQDLKQAVDRADQLLDEAEASERSAWQQASREPRAEIEPANLDQPADPAAADGGWRLVVAALAAGMAMTLGIGMVSAGTAVDPVVRDAAELEPLLSAPVLGTVPAEERSRPAPAQGSRAGQFLRVLIGLALVAGCLFIIWQGLHFE